MREGPIVNVTMSSYTCQGDSGSNLNCAAMNGRHIGDTRWRTPDWCPYRVQALVAAGARIESIYSPAEAQVQVAKRVAGILAIRFGPNANLLEGWEREVVEVFRGEKLLVFTGAK